MGDLVKRLRSTPLYEAHGEMSGLPEEAADEIDQVQRERDEARAYDYRRMTCMGVGDGSGNLYVYGDYGSIKALQGFVIRAEERIKELHHLHRALDEARAAALEEAADELKTFARSRPSPTRDYRQIEIGRFEGEQAACGYLGEELRKKAAAIRAALPPPPEGGR